MRIIDIEIESYKSFDLLSPTKVSTQTNVVIGQNNVGKTALLEAISLRIGNRPHRNSRFRAEQSNSTVSLVRVTFEIRGLQLLDYITASAGRKTIAASDDWLRDPSLCLTAMQSNRAFIFCAGVNGAGEWIRSTQPVLTDGSPNHKRQMLIIDIDKLTNMSIAIGGDTIDDFSPTLASYISSKIYFFDSIRRPSPQCGFGPNQTLLPDASNLAEVLNILMSEHSLFKRFNDLVTRVVPSVKWVTVKPHGGNALEVKISMVEEALSRTDLLVPLSQCGTGVGQILSILYLVARPQDNIIIIDEPNSFLHPNATRELINILKTETDQQIFLSTHSTEVVFAAAPERLFLIRMENEKSHVEVVDRNKIEDARQIVAETGSRLSEIFGYDRVIWVEGQTEVTCMPLLLAEKSITLSPGTIFAAMGSTGDLTGKHADVLLNLYNNFSKLSVIIPDPVRFLLDRDLIEKPSVQKLVKRFPNIVSFLPRYTYENYLICLNALEAIMKYWTVGGQQVTRKIIEQWLVDNGGSEKYLAKNYQVFSPGWLIHVNSTKLLTDLFAITDSREVYRKPDHSVSITKWIVQNDPQFLTELIDFVGSISV